MKEVAVVANNRSMKCMLNKYYYGTQLSYNVMERSFFVQLNE